VYIPKKGKPGELRPLGVPTLEDKIVQRATVEVLNAIYEQGFLGFSYGFRPGRSPHQALDALAVGIGTKKVNWVLDADIRRFYDTLDHVWLVKFVEHRVADRRVVRLIQKWLKAGVLHPSGGDLPLGPRCWKRASEYRVRWGRFRAGVSARCCRISICTTHSTSGFSNGDRRRRAER
jgi:hypothetical protein